ncbi:MAG TPA: GyrI-like domain-containing protein [Roseiflexaceae bacterium]|jgi:effector-binding domain-containing protein
MKITDPKLEDRTEQPYMGIRTQVPMKEMGAGLIPRLHGEVFAWLKKQGVAPAGAPFIRFHVINMESKMDIEMGVPVASALSGDGRVTPGVLPAGRYATLVYTGVRNGIKANKALIDWATEKGIAWDRWDTDKGDAFRSRIESYLTDPADEPDQAKWETEVAIRLADDQAR